MLLTINPTLSYDAWPPLPAITDISDSSNSPLVGSPVYLVQSPDNSVGDKMEESLGETVGTRFNTKTLNNTNVNVRTRWRMWPRKGTLKVIQHPPL
jgi:hypothetical protein